MEDHDEDEPPSKSPVHDLSEYCNGADAPGTAEGTGEDEETPMEGVEEEQHAEQGDEHKDDAPEPLTNGEAASAEASTSSAPGASQNGDIALKFFNEDVLCPHGKY